VVGETVQNATGYTFGVDTISFETHPSRYRHLALEVDSDRARIILQG